MAALVNPSTGLTVDAVGESYEALIKAGFKPVEHQEPKPADDEQPKRRARRTSTAKE